MNLAHSRSRFIPGLDITPLIDVVFILLVFLLLTMTFSEDKTEVEEATQTPTPPASITLLIDESGSLYQSDAPAPKTQDELKLYLAEKLLAAPDLNVNVKADHRARHGQVISALDMLKELGIQRVHLVIEKTKE